MTVTSTSQLGAAALAALMDSEVVVLHDALGSDRAIGVRGKVSLVKVTDTALELIDTRRGCRLTVPRRSVKSIERFA